MGTSTSTLTAEYSPIRCSAPFFRWSDEEDQSYKIRRSATKLLSSIIATRPELLVTLYKEVSPVLISRFGDREETVRLEVWATYVTLLTQTRLYGGGPQTRDSVGVKRKRIPDGSDPEETAYSLLQAQIPALAKALLNQLKSPRSSTATLQAGFGLLHTLLQSPSGFPFMPNQLDCIDIQIYSITASIDVRFNFTYHLSAIHIYILFHASPADVLEFITCVDTRSPQDTG